MIHAGCPVAEISFQFGFWESREIIYISGENSPAFLQAHDEYCSLKKLWVLELVSYGGSLHEDSCCRDLVSN